MRLFVACCVLLPTLALADELPDAGTSAPTPTPTAEAPPAPPATEVVPPETPTEVAPAPDDAKDKKKKKKHKHDGDGDDAGGDLVHADDVGGVGGANVNFRFLLQTRYAQTFVKESFNDKTFDSTKYLDPRLDDGYFINRAFMRVTADPYEWLTSKLLVDFAELQHKNPKHALKLAYAELKPSDQLSVTVGLFKRTYSLLELLPIADYELANPGPTDALIKNAELGGRDTGVMAHWSPLKKKKRLGLYLGVFSSDLHGIDARPYGVITARVVSETKHWRFGVDTAIRPHGETPAAPGLQPNPDQGQAVSADVTYHHKRYEIRSEWLWGSRGDGQNRGTARNWIGAWAIAAVRFPLDCGVVLMPAARFEWLDSDIAGVDPVTKQPVGRRFYVTGALNVMNMTDNFRVLLDLSLQQVQPHTYPIDATPVLQDRSSAAVTLQAQVKI